MSLQQYSKDNFSLIMLISLGAFCSQWREKLESSVDSRSKVYWH